MAEEIITRHYLRTHPNEVFVFGDNKLRRGHGGAAALRDEPNVYGFITQKRPSAANDAHYHPTEYREIYRKEIFKLSLVIATNPTKTYLISRVGGGLANTFRIFQKVIEPNIKKDIGGLSNVRFLW